MTTDTDFAGLSQIGQIAINVQDVERATAFYRDTLGMRFLFAFPGLAFFDCGGEGLMLRPAGDPQLGDADAEPGRAPQAGSPGFDPLLPRRRHRSHAPGPGRPRRALRDRAAPGGPDARS